ncbi:DUF1190 domain-containing protein [Marinobacter zhejiangensis]|uniref:Uncharacterized conserved protein YgiB, involved in bioifilm formation, UPF0441/DUF1190 family n=1 Tax=Marinobacter zhejiangensis TaxID=488535 RepID=A0A1I4LP04_9GAMM|nr:DUF1190 domain-containing protein [Marinobacter zhejiangensis]SFL92566.1 Uncharacterized conserved protein YgiB, involved in bioifilm formation, UPF0441/DUF1190 family [Marinobacter zhejiangensis]
MKRTSTINLHRMRKQFRARSLAPLSAAIGVILSGCSSEENLRGYVFNTAADCTARLPQQANQCEYVYKEALQSASRYAPRYGNNEDCESEFGEGNCDNYTRPSSSYYSYTNYSQPRMSGFLARPLYKGSTSLVAEPLLRYDQGSRSGFGRYTIDGKKVELNNMGEVDHAQRYGTRSFSTSSHTLSRGGFGQTVSRMSSSRSSSWSSGSSSRSGGWSWGG